MDATKINFTSGTWIALTKHLKEQRSYYLELLKDDQDEKETAKLRGKIAMIDDLLDLQRDSTLF